MLEILLVATLSFGAVIPSVFCADLPVASSSSVVSPPAPRAETLRAVIEEIKLQTNELTVQDMATGDIRVFKVPLDTRITLGGNKKKISLSDLKQGHYGKIIVEGDVAQLIHVTVGAAKIKRPPRPKKNSDIKTP